MSEKNKPMEGEIEFGPFWQIAPDSTIAIYHEGLNRFLAGRGYFYLKTDTAKRLCHKEGRLVEECDIADICRLVYDFINSDAVPEKLPYNARKKELLNLFVRGIDNYINYPKLRLLPIVELKFHTDTKEECFLYFNNGVVRITKDNTTTDGYIALNEYVWKRKIKPHTFTLLNADEPIGEFETFCFRVCNKDTKRFESLKTIIGYLLHRYWFASKPVIPCFLDETTLGVEEANGRTGKSLICQALRFVRNVVDIDGKSFDPTGSFAFQRVNMDTEILFVDDLDRRVSFESWFSIVTTGIEINQKNKAAYKIPKEQLFKIVLNSNFPIKSISGRSSEHRKVEFECSSYYGDLKPSDEFGHEFFTDWDDAEFNRMFNFFTSCVQAYFKTGILTPPSTNYQLRQLISAITPDLKEYLDEKFCSRATERYIKKDLYDEFLRSYPGQRNYFPSPNRFILKVHKYLEYHKVQFTEIPANKRNVIEIIDWGDMPIVDDVEEATEEYKTLSGAPHDYKVVTVPATTSPKVVPGGQAMSFAEAMGAGNTNTNKDEAGTTTEPPK